MKSSSQLCANCINLATIELVSGALICEKCHKEIRKAIEQAKPKFIKDLIEKK